MNLHMTHLEDLVFDHGEEGLDTSYSLLANRYYYGYTVKYDGAPSVFVGIDNIDGNYFVATKSIANKKPIKYKSLEEIPNTPLGEKLKVVFTECKCLGIRSGFLQGDVMWTDDVKFDGTVSTFQANTLIYETKEDLSKYKLGIAFHTIYFNDASGLHYTKCSTDSWVYDNPNLKLLSNNKLIQETKYYYNELNDILEEISRIKNIRLDLNDKFIMSYGKTYMNYVAKTDNHLTFDKYLQLELQKKIQSMKSSTGKSKWINLLDANIESANRYNQLFDLLFKIAKLKNEIIEDIDRDSSYNTYLEKLDGTLESVGHEGYVLECHGMLVKMVNRQVFSRANFSNEYKKAFAR